VQPTAVCNVESTEDDTVRDEMIEHDLFAQHDIQASQWKCPACMNIIAYPHDGILLTDDESLAKKVVAQLPNYTYVDGMSFHIRVQRNKKANSGD